METKYLKNKTTGVAWQYNDLAEYNRLLASNEYEPISVEEAERLGDITVANEKAKAEANPETLTPPTASMNESLGNLNVTNGVNQEVNAATGMGANLMEAAEEIAAPEKKRTKKD